MRDADFFPTQVSVREADPPVPGSDRAGALHRGFCAVMVERAQELLRRSPSELKGYAKANREKIASRPELVNLLRSLEGGVAAVSASSVGSGSEAGGAGSAVVAGRSSMGVSVSCVESGSEVGGAGSAVVSSLSPVVTPPAPRSRRPSERLRSVKRMLDGDLITRSEAKVKRAKILEDM